ncbi:hypothetical protein B9T31_09910 [Acinetobacter sp. ANC 4558]|uniref:VWA domain-containing protein n=1 Tax=Acinetobacter sp. ANC 4558 TaxID=1977876 RepID=UPI000A34902A|nr:VWA domain-containing protein [Acinetobacter sp. ANC 4558]OTG85895.1 hypothetical protein B9T31_09910 [Acinetobacter sp. ANC 4558]
MSSIIVDRKKSLQALSRLTDQLYAELSQSSLKHWLNDQKVEKHLVHKVKEWAFQAKSNLDEQHPFLDEQQQLEYWMCIDQFDLSQLNEMIEQYHNFSQNLGRPDLTDLWRNTLQSMYSLSNAQLQAQLVLEKWQRQLTEAIANWEFEQLSLLRDAFLDEIKDFLTTLQRMSKYQDSVGMETGILIDYSKGKLSSQDVEQFEQWADYLETDQELKQLCYLIGSTQPDQKRRKRQNVVKKSQSEVEIEDVFAQQELSGIKLAQELNFALPSELALLADPDLQILFDIKYLESNLMSFNTQGLNTARLISDTTQQKKQVGQKGPMIICLDTSGSMNGQPELIAKAICLYLSIQALKTKRMMCIINFSTNLTTLDLQKNTSFDDLIHFLSQSFHGGTDIVPALTHSLSLLETLDFHQADIVVISDFIMGNLNSDIMQNIQEKKQKGHGFYAVAIANLRLDHLDENVFDHQWVYQSKMRKVIQLK